MNLQVLKKSRKHPMPGDIFAYQIQAGKYGFGRVIRTDARLGNIDDVILLYFHDAVSASKHDAPTLSPSRLLVPPIGTDRAAWWHGYFETVAQRHLTANEVLKVHCFKRGSLVERYCDEYGNALRERTEPCGVFALDGAENIDYMSSEAYGIPVSIHDRTGRRIKTR